MPMADDQDQRLWAEVRAIARTHGEDAVRWVAERTVAAKLHGDDASVGLYREIAWRLDALLAPPPVDS